LKQGKRGYFEKHQSPILYRLGIEAESWIKMTKSFEAILKRLAWFTL